VPPAKRQGYHRAGRSAMERPSALRLAAVKEQLRNDESSQMRNAKDSVYSALSSKNSPYGQAYRLSNRIFMKKNGIEQCEKTEV
jgi:hypothetical protein